VQQPAGCVKQFLSGEVYGSFVKLHMWFLYVREAAGDVRINDYFSKSFGAKK
jgi:hypothetical protein